MADIPVRKTEGGGMWWLWVLLALIVAALLLWWVLGDDDEAAVEPAGVEAVGVAPAETGPITDVGAAAAGTPESLVGRQVLLNGVTVLSVVSDAGFWIGSGPNNRVFAVLTENPTPEQPTEGMVEVTEGATVDLVGTIRTNPGNAELAAGSETNIPQDVDRYIVVSNYRITGNAEAGAGNAMGNSAQ